MSSGFTWHSDGETPEQISGALLESITRAYAKIVVESAAVPIAELRSGL
jgi:hypothetical protein